jgi:HTH-type transcriptional regulator, global nitrogen regulator NrpRI
MKEQWSRKELAILNILKVRSKPVSSPEILELLRADAFEISERTVRYYLDDLASRGQIAKFGRKGFSITAHGLDELNARSIIAKVGFLSARINSMAFKMSFDADRMSGTVVVNVSVVDPAKISGHLPLFREVFNHGLAMGKKIILLPPGAEIGEVRIPPDMIGIGTVCSITLNGALLKAGVPVQSRFGGILQVEGGEPMGFADIIMYDGTSMDPLEIFIRSGMTDYIGAIRTGRGRVGAGFREMPAETVETVHDVERKMRRAGLGGFTLIGAPGRPLLQVPVNEGCVGAIVMGGLNPVAVFEESGVRVFSRALSGLVDYSELFDASELESRIRKIS